MDAHDVGAVHQRVPEALAPLRHRQLIVGGHSAFAYLARRYGLEQVALYGISPNAEPTPKKMAELVTLMRENKLAIDHVRVERSEIEETGEYDLEGLFIRLGHAIDSIGAKRVVLENQGALKRSLELIESCLGPTPPRSEPSAKTAPAPISE